MYTSVLNQTCADSNLGKPWFHDSVDEEEAVELLMKSEFTHIILDISFLLGK